MYDVTLDPFCGYATTCVAAEKLDREWIGIDISIKAYDLVREWLQKEAADPGDIFIIHMRTDQDADYREQKYVYVISHPNFPGEYKIEYKWKTTWFREIEKHIHNKCPNKHEWVQVELDQIIQSIKDYKHITGEQATLPLD